MTLVEADGSGLTILGAIVFVVAFTTFMTLVFWLVDR